MANKNTTKGNVNRKLSKTQIFDILASKQSQGVLALRHNVSARTINSIRRGVTYKEYYKEYTKTPKGEILGIIESMGKLPCKAYYFHDTRYLRISFDDLLLSIDLVLSKLTDISFNGVILGQRIEYYDAMNLLRKHKMLC